mgnify:CR=1 FL=1
MRHNREISESVAFIKNFYKPTNGRRKKMIYYKVQNVMTKDGQLVCLDIGANTNVQTILGDIVKYINQNMDQSVAITSKSPCYSVQSFPSQSGATIKFGISFILTYSNNYSCVLDASVITAVEI